MLFRLALRELKRSWRFGLFFIFNLSLGLTGFVSVESFKGALESVIDANAKNILSADIAVSARRELTEDEQAKMREIMGASEESKTYEFFAMLSSSKGSRLILVKAIDQAYPFYGALKLQSGSVIEHNGPKEILTSNKAWIYPELKAQLGLDVGDQIELGQLKLQIADLVEKDETQTFRAATLAPRVFINRALIPQSGLIQFGSTYSVAHLFKMAPAMTEEVSKENLYKVLSDPQISVETPKTAGEDSGRQMGYLSDYLGLVAIVALFMSTLGASYIYRLFLSQRMKEIAILRTLGLQSIQAVGVYIIQASLLGVLATIPTLAVAHVLLPILAKILGTLTPFDLQPHITLSSIGVCFLMAVIGSFVVSLPFLMNIFDLKPSKLFSEEKFSIGEGQNRYWTYLPMLAIFYFLSVYQAHSWRIGTVFAVSLVVMILLLMGAGYASVSLAGKVKGFRRWFVKYSLKSFSRRQGSSLAIFVAMGLGALLINILPQLKNTLQEDFMFDKTSKVPALFMFDIQDEQVQGVEEALKTRQLDTLGLSAMIRGRILKVNDQDYERKIEATGFKTREEEREARFRNRGVNLSYRTSLSGSETIVDGRPFSGDFNPDKQTKAELSVELRFAERMGLKVGDTLIFDVQGVEVEGEIINLRRVKWTSFQPNFFILVQNGVLNEAPKTFIAAVPFLEEKTRESLQNELAQKFPNVSIIDVVKTVNEVMKTAEQMSWSLELMAVLALITGYIVLYSIVRSQIKLRRWELNMLKVLGASSGELTSFILVEFGFLAFLSALVGAGLSIFVSAGFSVFLFESAIRFEWLGPLVSVLIITALSILVSLLASLDVVRESSLSILREEK
ncbi:FtsX-like permease family protein [compost metagenome]